MSSDDVIVHFVEVARRMLHESFQRELQERSHVDGPSWSWVCTKILACCKAYPGGVTSAILLSDLYASWLERVRNENSGRFSSRSGVNGRGANTYQMRKQRQLAGMKITTIDSILERKFVSLDAVLDVIIVDVQLLRGDTYLLTLGDAWSVNTIEMYLHSKFFDLVDETQGVLRKSRELRITGCGLGNSHSWDSASYRLLPTDLMVVLLDEERDEDCCLLAATYCNDYFASIQLPSNGESDYRFYASVERIEAMELPGQQQENVKSHRMILRDHHGDVVPFLLWNEHVCLSNLLSKGSMVAIERPVIGCHFESDDCTVAGLWFQYGCNTRLYTVPIMSTVDTATEDDAEVQTSPTDTNFLRSVEQGQRILVESVRPKMSKLALYGLVTHLSRSTDNGITLGGYKCAYVLRIGDNTGVLDIQMYFTDQWSVGEVHVGQMVFVCGIETEVGLSGGLECIWVERPGNVSLINMTQLPTLLSTSCLHRVVPLCKISSSSLTVQVCKVRTGNLVQHGVKYCHVCCGRPVVSESVPHIWRCNFCERMCEPSETILSFFLTILLVDAKPGQKTQAYATCSGQAAREIMQTEPEDFCSWPEIEQGMYLYSLENELFLVTLYSGLQDDMGRFQTATNAGDAITCLRIGQALKTNPD